MLECLLDGHSLERIERKCAPEKVERFWTRVGIKLRKLARLLERERSEVVAGATRSDPVESVRGRDPVS